ncbi:MAG: helicase associated domain-containing protein [Paraclostridium sp.]
MKSAEDREWIRMFNLLDEYVKQHGAIPDRSFILENGDKLGGWSYANECYDRAGLLKKWKRSRLEKIPGWMQK